MRTINVYVQAFSLLAAAYRAPSELTLDDVRDFERDVSEPLRLFGVTLWLTGDDLMVRVDGHMTPQWIKWKSLNFYNKFTSLAEIGKLVVTRAGVEQMQLEAA